MTHRQADLKERDAESHEQAGAMQSGCHDAKARGQRSGVQGAG